ncbi:MAG: hypothetical protein JNK87_15540 [Bryobacterales bacterium]|nr:hypothetical protein [Bryobacterales bacterium]
MRGRRVGGDDGLVVGIYRLVRGTASVLAAEQAALGAVVQALQVINRVK